MIADFNLHDTGGGNPHAHILLTMRPLDEKGAWLPKSKKEYVLDENGEKIRLPSGRYKTRKVDLVDWNNRENAEVWRRAWADLANDFLAQNNRPERIDHRSHAERGMDELPTVHMGVATLDDVRVEMQEGKAYQWRNTRLGYWRFAGSPVFSRSITNKRLAAAGYFSILNRYEPLHLYG